MPQVPQTSVIFFALFIGFVVYITVRGHLSGYLWVLGLSNAAPGGTSLGISLPASLTVSL